MVPQEWRHWWEVVAVVVVYVPVWLSAPAMGEGDIDIAGCPNWGGREEAKGRWVGEGGSWEGGGGERKINSMRECDARHASVRQEGRMPAVAPG